jgi:N-acetylmuramoyl-L-alanine amidase
MRRLAVLTTMLGLALLAVGGPARVAGAATVTSLRAWSAPTTTRIVFDLSGDVAPVMPDSGVSRELVVSVPGGPLARGLGVPASLTVGDGVVDSVQITPSADGGRCHLWFKDETSFHAFVLRPDGDKPFRVVVDVARPGTGVVAGITAGGIAAEAAPATTHTVTPKGRGRRIIAVDAGHGGEDTGARGPRGVLEKTVTLAVARALVTELNRDPGIDARLTRDGDFFIPLVERYRRAEKMKADVFISVHANSTPRRRSNARGTEVYFLSLSGASDQADKDLADTENAADLVGGVPPQADNDLVNILYDVKRSSALQQSQLLAEMLLDNVAVDRRESRGVKQAGFVVLKSVEFPSVLVETAFINNPAEAKLLASPDFQRQMAKQLATGVRAYFARSGIGLAEPEGSARTQAGR